MKQKIGKRKKKYKNSREQYQKNDISNIDKFLPSKRLQSIDIYSKLQDSYYQQYQRLIYESQITIILFIVSVIFTLHLIKLINLLIIIAMMIRTLRGRLSCFFSSNQSQKGKDNHFGFKDVGTQEKQPLVNQVFHSVASKYDVMNDFMSLGIHRYWKQQFVSELGNLAPTRLYTHLTEKPIVKILDVAGGTGDIAFKILENHPPNSVKLTVLDINSSMLEEGKRKAQAMGLTSDTIQFVCANAEELPFQDKKYDAYTISFGLRNVPRTRKALEEARRVLKFGGRFMCLEFSKVQNALFREFYRQYSFNVIPQVGQLVAGDRSSYQYLVESIQRFLTQQQLKNMMEEVGMQDCTFTNYTDGIVALHSGFRLD